MKENKPENSIGFQFGTFMRVFRKLVVKRFHENNTGLTLEQYAILFKISEEKEPTQTVIAHSIGIDKSAVMRMIDVLEKKRFVARFGDEGDRRKKILALTVEGSEKVKEVELFFDTILSEVSEGVQQKDLGAFFNVLEKLRTNAERQIN